jgi:hypothetical protein
MKFINLIMLVVIAVLNGCGRNPNEMKLAKEKSDILLDAIGNGTANEMFPVKYFPKHQTASLMSELRNNCDFKNRKGNFINDFYQKVAGSDDEITLIYEFYLECDTARFLITYLDKNNNELELYGFKIEPVEKANKMILRKDRELKNK